MVTISYIPDRGDIIYLSFGPTRGMEQRGRRPALVLTPRRYNERVGLLIVCPITSHLKGYAFEVPFTLLGKENAILCDHMRSVDWKMRNTTYVDSISDVVLEKVSEKIIALLKD